MHHIRCINGNGSNANGKEGRASRQEGDAKLAVAISVIPK